MHDWTEIFRQFPPTKWLVVVGFAVLGSLMQRDMTIKGRVITFVSGILIAVVFAERIRTGLTLDPAWSDAVSAFLALTGHNLASFAMRASKDPTNAMREIMEIWRGRK